MQKVKHRWETNGAVTLVWITRRDGEIFETIWDTEDWLEYNKYSIYIWPNKKNFYIQIADANDKRHLLHRILIPVSVDMLVDHENCNGLDNRKINLRIVTNSQNQQNIQELYINNTSGYRGVSWHKKRNKWAAGVRLNSAYNHLGLYVELADAVEAVRKFRAENMPFSKEAEEARQLCME